MKTEDEIERAEECTIKMTFEVNRRAIGRYMKQLTPGTILMGGHGNCMVLSAVPKKEGGKHFITVEAKP